MQFSEYQQTPNSLPFQHSDNPEVWGDLKRKELDYELRRAKKEQYFESVKTAQSVAIDEIPLPQLPTDGDGPSTAPPPGALHRAPPVLLTNVPVPSFLQQQQLGILKKPPVESSQQKLPLEKERDKKEPPGCPPGPPPILALLRELDDGWVEDAPSSKRSKLRFSDEAIAKDEQISAQKRQAIAAGKTIDDLMREVEHDQRRREERKDRDRDRGSEDEDSNQEEDEDSDSDDDEEGREKDAVEEQERMGRMKALTTLPPVNSAPPPTMSVQLPPALPPPIHSYPGPPQKQHLIVPPPPPPMRPSGMAGMPLRMPGNRPGMPPGQPPPPPPHRMGMRMPPGPPPGMPPPPRMKHHHHHHSNPHHQHHHQQGGYHHNQHHNSHHSQANKDPKTATIITAKPQIRNLSADVTRFVPSTLRTKKEEKGPQRPPHMMVPSAAQQQKLMMMNRQGQGAAGEASNKGKTKDDAYMQFMREMQGLL